MDFVQGKSLRKLKFNEEYWDKFVNYLDDKIWPEGEVYENYIILYYGKSVEYNAGFANQYRKNISYIMIGTDKKTATDSLSIEEDTKVEIYFSCALTSLESFFDVSLDDKMESLKSVDLSHLDATQITSFAYLFFECTALKSVIPTKVPTLSLTTMMSMFEGCSSILAIDLSKYDISQVTNMDYLFSGCKSVKVIDFSCNNFGNIVSANSFIDFTAIIQLFIYNIEIIFGVISSQISRLEDYGVFGDECYPSFTSCCEINSETGECEYEYEASSSYITVIYGRDAKYDYFIRRDPGSFDEISVSYLKIGEKFVDPYSPFEVKNGNKVDIFFKSEVYDISNLFKDKEYIISVDFSNFNSSNINNIDSLFNGCTSLKSVDLTSFNTQIANLNEVFYNCK